MPDPVPLWPDLVAPKPSGDAVASRAPCSMAAPGGRGGSARRPACRCQSGWRAGLADPAYGDRARARWLWLRSGRRRCRGAMVAAVGWPALEDVK